jgi:hypothetical protein
MAKSVGQHWTWVHNFFLIQDEEDDDDEDEDDDYEIYYNNLQVSYNLLSLQKYCFFDKIIPSTAS